MVVALACVAAEHRRSRPVSLLGLAVCRPDDLRQLPKEPGGTLGVYVAHRLQQQAAARHGRSSFCPPSPASEDAPGADSAPGPRPRRPRPRPRGVSDVARERGGHAQRLACVAARRRRAEPRPRPRPRRHHRGASGTNAGRTSYHGHEGLLQILTDWAEGFVEFEMTPQEFAVGNDRQVGMRLHQRAVGARSGVPIEADFWFVHMMRDQKRSRAWTSIGPSRRPSKP